jgi:DivIVA domain-containing protein
VAEQAPREPYVPGSGDKLPAELRLVLGGYAGFACGWFAGGLACATAVVFVLFDANIRSAVFKFFDADIVPLVVAAMVCGLGLWWAQMAFERIKARIRFSRLLRRPSDPCTATVTASRDDGRTVILDIIPQDGTRRRYQSLYEVRLALWLKAGMLVPGETVTVYGGSGGASELLVTSPRWGRAFLGTVTSGPTVQRGPVEPLDENVSGATLVDWAAWAASTTFSSTGRRFGYDTREVDAFRSAVRDTFLGGAVFWVSTPPVRSDDLRGQQFSTHRPGYEKNEVDAFLEAAGVRLAAMESTDRPAGPLVSGAFLAEWAEWADSTTFDWRSGYTATEVDSYLRAIRDTFLGVSQSPVRADNVRGKQFSSTDAGYDKMQVDAFLHAAGIRLAAMESTDTPTGPLASDAIRADWAEWADSTRFSTTAHLSQGYNTAEVDAFREELRDTFLGVREPRVMSNDLRSKQFSTHRPGYYKTQVDAFLEKAAWRLAATESTKAMDWSPPPWAEPPLDKVSLIGLITAIPGLGLVSIPLGIWGVIRTKNHQLRGRTLAVISFVVIGLWAIVGTVVGVMAGLSVTSTTDQTAAPAPSAPSTVPGDQPQGPLRKAKRVDWNQLKTGDCFNGFADTAGWKDAAVSPTRVDCRSMHEEEVTGTFTLPGGRHYPGDLAIEDASDARCEKYFDRYVGIDWDSSDYFYDYLTPSPRTGDRGTTRPSAWPMTLSIRRPTRSPCAT